jgi:hypothetical protein
VSSSIRKVDLQLPGFSSVLTASEAMRSSVWRLGLIFVFCLGLVACGGGSKSFSSSTATPSTPAANPSPSSTGTLTSATPVALAGGQSVSGVNVVVAPPVSPLNADDLGATTVSGRGSASNTGSAVHRGSTMRVLLFGSGLNGDMMVLVAGPPDITVSNVTGIQATDNTPGIAFNATVASNASLGARTVYLKNSNGDMTSFTGGLEVVP